MKEEVQESLVWGRMEGNWEIGMEENEDLGFGVSTFEDLEGKGSTDWFGGIGIGMFYMRKKVDFYFLSTVDLIDLEEGRLKYFRVWLGHNIFQEIKPCELICIFYVLDTLYSAFCQMNYCIVFKYQRYANH